MNAVPDLAATMASIAKHDLTLPSLADELRLQYGVKAEALAKAYEDLCRHKNWDRFSAEIRAIKGCPMADGVERLL